MNVDIQDASKARIEIVRSDLSDLDVTLSLVIRESLKQFRKHADCYPSDHTSMAAWKKTIGKMLYAFDTIASGEAMFGGERYGDPGVDEGLKLFAQYFQDLWK